MRILAIDFGERRIGLAISDEMGITAQGMETLVIHDETTNIELVAGMVEKTGAEKIVLGLPLNMNGTESEKSMKVREFAEKLFKRTPVPLTFWDERLTSVQAQRVMKEIGKKQLGNKSIIDRISATLILQEYLKTLS